MSDWNPALYLKYEKERTQPAKDLISRIRKDDPARIIDIGCGPGNSTAELRKRWKNAQIIGLDNSEAMLEKAREDYPDLSWIAGDASGDLSHLGKFDIIFSNAVIQWLPDHKSLLERFFSMLQEGGVLAVQMPNTTFMPIRLAVQETAGEAGWRSYFENSKAELHYEEPGYYYDVLSSLTREVDLWETHYQHIVPGHEAIVEMYKSTGMKPYLAMLNEGEQEAFARDVLEKIRKEYAIRRDGRVLFPFRRIFFTAYKEQ